MPNIQSAKKRMRQNEKRRVHNKSIKSAVKTHVKNFLSLVEKGEAEQAKKELPVVTSQLDKAWQKGLYHKNYVARKKSSLHKKLNNMAAAE
ncbi:30S ribosomal protein S20 [Candidatus Uabimicrobium amorphum]|uniref:Small ribosomal subunit protein bS20 n=1 Tax=Uabimicrobium amorphum TaxID=2596890 RepID=A0A5S9F0X5_UABAM|nr:30S ribosomal protein S20 [Candidatus Uabimicrobium amorphum]BBM81966.1 30S ribosomal protein S20 [Candidatus Uabimicrobium amorphum]